MPSEFIQALTWLPLNSHPHLSAEHFSLVGKYHYLSPTDGELSLSSVNDLSRNLAR